MAYSKDGYFKDLQIIHTKVNPSPRETLYFPSRKRNKHREKLPDLRVPSVIVLFIFNNIFGFLAYHFAVSSKNEWTKENYKKAKEHFKSSLTYLLIGILFGLTTYTLLITLYVNHTHLFCSTGNDVHIQNVVKNKKNGCGGKCVKTNFISINSSGTFQTIVRSDGTTSFSLFSLVNDTLLTSNNTTLFIATEMTKIYNFTATNELCKTDEMTTTEIWNTSLFSSADQTESTFTSITTNVTNTFDTLSTTKVSPINN
ncbi:Hypothetical predicted protein [Mytilus galloprovincialis]|uniref:Uncharacterized protein n=1 Tax=Mytilus galloprovincialis TaxID=29158 RepID=A0A8B6H4E7_MYTGA|nr:Hypothetical predicted protein [Mytilus galloprovincialis]